MPVAAIYEGLKNACWHNTSCTNMVTFIQQIELTVQYTLLLGVRKRIGDWWAKLV